MGSKGGGGGGGGKKGGGGGGSTQVQTPQLGNLEGDLQTTSDWERYFLTQPYSMGNWALANATGGQVSGAGSQQYSRDVGGGIQLAAPQQFGANSTTQGGVGTSQGAGGGGGGGGGSTDWLGLLSQFMGQQETGMGQESGIMGQETGTMGQESALMNPQNTLANPFQPNSMAAFTQDLSNQLGPTLYGLEGQISGTLSGANNGLLPGQNEMIDVQTQQAQEAVKQQLASEGLSSSTMNADLTGQLAQTGAGQKGQLVQGNLGVEGGLLNSLVGTGGGLQLQAVNEAQAMQQQQFNQQAAQFGQQAAQFGQTASQVGQSAGLFGQASGEQQALMGQALQSYGLESQFVNNVLGPYGYELQAYQTALQGSEAQAQINAGLQQAEMQSQQQGMSSLFSGLGSLLGGSGGGGGLLGSLGGLFGGAAGGAAAAGGAGAGASAAIDAIGLAALA